MTASMKNFRTSISLLSIAIVIATLSDVVGGAPFGRPGRGGGGGGGFGGGGRLPPTNRTGGGGQLPPTNSTGGGSGFGNRGGQGGGGGQLPPTNSTGGGSGFGSRGGQGGGGGQLPPTNSTGGGSGQGGQQFPHPKHAGGQGGGVGGQRSPGPKHAGGQGGGVGGQRSPGPKHGGGKGGGVGGQRSPGPKHGGGKGGGAGGQRSPGPKHAGGGGRQPAGHACPTSAPFLAGPKISNGTIQYTVVISGCPPYDWSSQSTPNTATQHRSSWTFRRSPIMAATPLYVGMTGPNGTNNSNPIMGPIGITVDGINLFSNVNSQHADAYIADMPTFDACGGHVQHQGIYHYHSDQLKDGCVYKAVAGQHSPLFGMMADSVPIYGPLGDNGIAPTNLDECGGHTDSTYPFYHYHTTDFSVPYTVACLRGCISTPQSNPLMRKHMVPVGRCQQATTQYDYSTFNPVFSSTAPGGAAVAKGKAVGK